MSVDTAAPAMIETDDFVVTSNTTPDADLRAAHDAPAPEPAPASDPEPEPEGEQEPDPASEAGKELAKKRGSLQARINALTREKYDTRREVDQARSEVAALRAELAELRTGGRQEQPAQGYVPTDQKPTADQFDNYDDFVEAKAIWAVEQRMKAAHYAQVQAQQQQAQHQVLATLQVRTEAFRATHPDYDDVANSVEVPNTPSAPAILAHLQHSDLGPALAYELGSRPDELARIASLPPGFAVAALGRLEHQIESRTAAVNSGPAPSALSQAKPPIKPVGGSPVTSDDGAVPDDLPVDEHIRRMNARDRAASRR